VELSEEKGALPSTPTRGDDRELKKKGIGSLAGSKRMAGRVKSGRRSRT